MSNEDRIIRQIEDLSSSIIKALESLEKELSEYIEVTDSRLHKLEEKMHKFESFIDVSGKGLVKAIETTKEQEKVSVLNHITTQPKQEQQIPIDTPITIAPPAPSSAPEETTTYTALPSPPLIEEKPEIEQEEIPISRISPIPTPPSFKTVLEDKSLDQPLTNEGTITKREGSIANELEEKQKKEDDKDKEDLLSALKTIDSL